jgi:hypothetical protein
MACGCTRRQAPEAVSFFTGPYDLRWGVEGSDQTIVFEGDALRQLTMD